MADVTTVELDGVDKAFGPATALAGFTASFAPGELVCLLGPSGCGKTTALRVLAGFERPDRGRVIIDGRDVTEESPERRRVGMVFARDSLFPNLTVRQNIEFGPNARGGSAADRAGTVEQMIDRLALDALADRYPHQLSGVQRQRVALARVLASKPRLLLLDEPWGALDTTVRESLRDEIRTLQQEEAVTTVLATHDPRDALGVADRVGVMSGGRLEQLATPRELYLDPANAFVAAMSGAVNHIEALGQADGRWRVLGRVLGGSHVAHPGALKVAAVRPEQVAVDEDGPATVVSVAFLGAVTRVLVDDPDAGRVIADLPSADARAMRSGGAVRIRLRDDVDHLVLLGMGGAG